MSDPSLFISRQVPERYIEDYPKFISFLEAYYDWLSRSYGFSEKEIEYLIAEKTWLTANIDKFIESGDLRYSGAAREDDVIIELSNQKTGEAFIDHLIPQYFLERTFNFFSDVEDEIFLTADGLQLESPIIDQNIVDLWFYKLGFPKISHNNLYGNYDQFLMIRCLKYIYSIKGTEKSVQLFFNIFFNEDVGSIYYPKFDIAIIDDNFIPDGTAYIRDDYYYNEYSYVIKVKNDPSTYQYIIDNIYLHYIHPAGFKMFLVQATT